MDFLWEIDQSLFHWINKDWSSSFLDSVMPHITDLHKNGFFVGTLVLTLGFFLYRFPKKSALFFFYCALTAGISDLFVYRLIKIPIHRSRPELVLPDVILRTHSHSGYSFPSNHASNVFALATFITLCFPRAWGPAFFVASLIALSRVYVGVHFPSDIFGGAILGSAVGYLIFRIYLRYGSRANKEKVT